MKRNKILIIGEPNAQRLALTALATCGVAALLEIDNAEAEVKVKSSSYDLEPPPIKSAFTLERYGSFSAKDANKKFYHIFNNRKRKKR
jgi:hypothetical protein